MADTTIDLLKNSSYIGKMDELIAAVKSGGVTAADVKMQVADGYIQYSTDRGKSWANLIALSELIGPAGPKGDTGPAGAGGKSAYQYAVEGGYTGTEEEFAAKLAEEIHPGTYPVVEMTTDVAELAPNTYYKWGEVLSLTITLGAAIEGVTNEYCFEFVSGATATKLTVPSTIKWVQETTVEAGKTYQVSILDGIGVMVGA